MSEIYFLQLQSTRDVFTLNYYVKCPILYGVAFQGQGKMSAHLDHFFYIFSGNLKLLFFFSLWILWMLQYTDQQFFFSSA